MNKSNHFMTDKEKKFPLYKNIPIIKASLLACNLVFVKLPNTKTSLCGSASLCLVLSKYEAGSFKGKLLFSLISNT